MKVLILHQYFNTPASGGSLRSYYLAKALVDKGINTVVITTHNQSSSEKKIIEGIEVHYLPVTYNNRFGFLKRIISFLRFVFSIVKAAGKFKDANVCYAISTPLTTGLAAIWIKMRYGIPFYFEVGDLWPDAPVQLGIIKNSILKSLLYRLEKSIYKRAKIVVALSDAIKKEIDVKIPGKTIHVIPNMADTDFFQHEPKQSQLVQKFTVESKFVVSYIGTLGLANGLDYFLKCADAAVKNKLSVHFILCGEGAEENLLKKLANSLHLTNISFLPFQNRKGVKEVMNITDAVFISFKPFPILETGSPNKYFDGLAAGKLIISNVCGWIKEEIESNACGVYVNPNQPNDFVEKVKPFLSQPELLFQYQTSARKIAEKTYSRKLISEQFQQLFPTHRFINSDDVMNRI